MPLNEYDEILQGTPTQASPYDSILKNTMASSEIALRGSMQAAATTTPERAASVAKLSDRLKLPRPVVDRNYDALSKKYDLSENDYSTLLNENPALTSWLSNPDNAAVARDDVPALQRIENTVYSFGRGWARASSQAKLADLLFKEVEQGLSPQEAAQRDALKLEQERFSNADKRNGIPEYTSGVTGYSVRQLGSSVYAGAEGVGYGGVAGALAGSVLPGVGTVAGGTAGMIAGGLSASAAYSYRMETGFAFDELRSVRDVNGNPIDPAILRNTARAVGAINAVIETGSEAALMTLVPGAGKLIGGLKGDAAKRAMLSEVKAALASPTRRQMLLGALGKVGGAASIEGIEEFVQSLVGAGGREVAQAVSGQTFAPDSFEQDITQASREAMDALVGTFFAFSPIGGAHYFAASRQAARAQQAHEFFTALGNGVQESKSFERLPESMQQFVAEATKDGPISTVYVPVDQWSTYWQSKGLDPATVAGEVLGERSSYEQAMNTGADMAIPMSAYATRIAPTEHNAFFAQELRLAPDEMNAREAGEFEKRIAEEQKKASEQQQQDESAAIHDQGVAAVQADVQAKLEAAGVEAGTAQAYAATHAAAFRSIAERAGVDPKVLYERYGLQVTRAGQEKPGETAMAQPKLPDGAVAGAPSMIEPRKVFSAELRNDFGYRLHSSDGIVSRHDVESVAHQIDQMIAQRTASIEAEQKMRDRWLEHKLPTESDERYDIPKDRLTELLDKGIIPTTQQTTDEIKAKYAKEIEKLKAQRAEVDRVLGTIPPADQFQTGKPVTVLAFHGSRSGNIAEEGLNREMLGSHTDAASARMGFFAAGRPETANSYTGKLESTALDALDDRERKTILEGERESFNEFNPIEAKEIDGDTVYVFDGKEYSNEFQAGDAQAEALVEMLRDTPTHVRDLYYDYFNKELREPSTPVVYPVLVHFDNPFVQDYQGERYREEAYAAVIAKARAAGHDGVILTNTFDGGPIDNVFVTFDEKQISFDVLDGRSGGIRQQFDQITPEQARSVDMDTKLPSDPLFAQAVANTPGASVDADGLSIDVVRFQKIEQEGAESVRTGVFYLPAGSKNTRHYKGGKQQYGGTEIVKGPTLLRAPLFVKGATGGKAPENAYDSIKGKGAYQKMRDEVLQAGGVMSIGERLSGSEKADRIGQTLEEHGADPSIAYELMVNSKQGNQLAYAMQENIVAHAVRAAGYDSVVGYSVERKTGKPFISEIFDVRETTYPIAGEDGTLHDVFSAKRMKQQGDAKRGRIRFGSERQFSIDLLENADLSTFIHESGHFWLEVLGDIHAELRTVPAEKLNEKQLRMRDDYVTLLKWLGVDDRSKLAEPQHEKFARAIEAYFMEGKAPSADLRTIFARVRAWMLSIYRSLTQLNVNLSPEVREVFDRMFATDEQIAQAQQEAAVEPLFMDAKQSGMTDTEFAAYRDKVEKASAVARDELQAKLMRTMQREREQWWKSERERVREEIAKDVNERRDVIAYHVLARDEMPDGSNLPYDLQRVKLRRADIDAMQGEGSWKNYPRGSTATDGVGLQAVADLLGYSSPDELLKAMRQAEPADRVIDRETDERMKAEHGDMLVDGSIVDAARQAVQNDQRVQVVQAELRALAKLARQAKPAVDAEKKQQTAKRVEGLASLDRLVPKLSTIRAAAQRAVASKRVRDVKPMQYLVAARRASQAAVEAAAKGEFTFAISSKQRELFNIELYRLSQQALDETESTVDYMHKFAEARTRARVAKAGQDYLDQIDGFLDRYEFARIPLKALDRRKALVQWVAEKERAGEPVDLPADVVLEKRINYKDMTVEELRGVRDSVKHIEHLARLKNRLLTAKRDADLERVSNAVAGSIADNAKGRRDTKIETRLPGDQAGRFIDGWFGSHRKLASFIREMDGFKDGGLLWEYLMRPLNEAGDRESTMNAEASRALKTLFDAFPGREMSALYSKQHIEAINAPLTKMGRLMVALNWGNDDNRQKLLGGYGWQENQVKQILDTLDERDWKFVQGVWDFIDAYWPQIEAKEKRVNGVAPEKVAPSTVLTRFGEFKGGYFPLKYDDRQDVRAYGDRVKEMADMQMRAGYTRSTTRRGHTQERIDGVKRPIRLDFGVIFEHVSQVVHDLSHHEALLDANRVLSSQPVRAALVTHYGDVTYKQINNTLADIAAGNIPAMDSFEHAINYLRQGATIAGLGWNVMTSLLQPLGMTQSMSRIGPRWVAQGLMRWMRGVDGQEGVAKWIQEKSPMMAARMRTQLREINEIRNEVGVNTGKLAGWVDEALRTTTFNTVTKQGIADSYFWLIYKGQQIADIPTWLGQYEKSLDAGEVDERAVALADQAVLDSQGGGQIKDLAAIQRGGPLMRLWTSFYSYFNTTYNLNVEAFKRTSIRNPASIGRLGVDLLMLNTLPATLAFLMKQALQGADDDEEKFLKKLLQENLAYLFGLMVGLREIGSTIQGFQGYSGPAGARFFSAVGNAITQSAQGDLDAAFWKSLNDLAGILFHYPAAQLKRTAAGAVALWDGDTHNPAVLLAGPPPKK